MRTLVQDIRSALRVLLKRPGHTAVIILTLALGIGASTTVFTVVDAVVLRPLSYDDPDRLMMIWETDPPRDNMELVTSYPTVEDWREMNHVFTRISTFGPVSHNLTGVDQPERLSGARVSAEFFPMLGIQSALGRTFLPEDDQPGSKPVTLLSHGFWQRHFGGAADAIGKTVSLDNIEFDVVGVLPARFDFPVFLSGADVWTTRSQDVRKLERRPLRSMYAAGRLKDGVTLEEAHADMGLIVRQLAEEYPRIYGDAGIRIVPLLEQTVGNVRPALLLLLGAVGLVLAVACLNVASLVLTRGLGRRGEFAVRAAMGAGRWRLVRQLMTESVVLSLIGGVCGVGLALWGAQALAALAPENLPRLDQIVVDSRVLVFALMATLGTSIVFGLAPAYSVSKFNLHGLLKESGRASSAMRRRFFHASLVASEVAMATVLLVGASLLFRSFQRVSGVDPGCDTRNVLEFYVDVGFARPLDHPQRAAFYGALTDRLKSLPGVESVFAGTALPLEPAGIRLGVFVEGRPPVPRDQMQIADRCSIMPDYFRGLGIPLLKGRRFTELDRRGSPGVMIINETLARRVFPDEDPIGRRVRAVMRLADDEPEFYEIVGVVSDVLQSIPGDPEPCTYIPSLQQTWPFAAFGLRSSGDPKSLIPTVRRELAALTKSEAAFGFRTLDEQVAALVAQRYFTMVLLGVFALAALSLACLGLYGMLAYAVAQRTHEIGIRMALGAPRRTVVRSVLRQGLMLTAVGLAIGLLMSAVGTRMLTSLLYEIRATDPVTFAGVCVVLVVVSFCACYLPARRATKVDPMVALRCE